MTTRWQETCRHVFAQECMRLGHAPVCIAEGCGKPFDPESFDRACTTNDGRVHADCCDECKAHGVAWATARGVIG